MENNTTEKKKKTSTRSSSSSKSASNKKPSAKKKTNTSATTKTGSATKKTATKKTATKKTATKKSGTKKTSSAKKPVSRKVAPKGTEMPEGLRSSKNMASSNIDSTLVKRKRSPKKKPAKKSLENRFWLLIGLAVLLVFGLIAFYIFKDYYKDSSTPREKNTADISKDNLTYIETIGSDMEIIKAINADPRGPIIYVTYTVPSTATREESMLAISTIFNTMVTDKPDMFTVYDFEVTVINASDDPEPEGQNFYPLSASININNYGNGLVWMDIKGTFVEPVLETENPDEAPAENSGP